MNKKENYTAIQKLDSILTIMNHNGILLDTVEELIEKAPFKTNNKEIKLILDKLILDQKADKFGLPISPESEIMRLQYHITFDGRLFIDKGGYKSQKRRELTLEILQFLATLAIVVGTLAAGYEPLKKIVVWFLKLIHISHT